MADDDHSFSALPQLKWALIYATENLALDPKGVNEDVSLVGAKLKQFTKWFVSLNVLICLQEEYGN